MVAATFVVVNASAAGRPYSGADGVRAGATDNPGASIWVDPRGGSCSRSSSPAAFAAAKACGSIDRAWSACRPGDTITVRAGSYGPLTISGDKASPGCVVTGEPGVTIGGLVTGGAFLTLRNVTIDVGDAKRAGWAARAGNVTLSNVRIHGPYATVDISGVANVSWLGGELGSAGQPGGRRVCGEDAEPVQIDDADHVTIDHVTLYPQDADPTPSGCSVNGFHLEMIRVDGGTRFFTLRNSTFVSGDHSGTASVFITKPEGGADPHDLTFANNFFGTNDSVGAFDVHSNVSTCLNFTFAYNTFLASPGIFQCVSAANVQWIGNLGARSPTTACLGSFAGNVWQDTGRDSCGRDTWVTGTRGQVDRLGLGGPDGFHLQPGSPAIDAGEALGYCTTALAGRDHDGQLRPRANRCDAGADELDAGGGAVDATLAAPTWRRTRSGARTLVLTFALEEGVAADLRLLRDGRMIVPRRYVRLRTGTRTWTLKLDETVPAGGARVRVALEDSAGNEKVVQLTLQIPRRS